MSVRIIEYEMKPDGISPADVQTGGVAGDHNATRLDFILSDQLKKSIEGVNAVYYFESYDSSGLRNIGDVQPLTDKVSFLLENRLTAAGGVICVHLVISEEKQDGSYMRLYSYPVYLNIISRQNSPVADNDTYEAIPTMAAMVSKRTAEVLAAADSATAAANRTEQTAIELAKGSEFIFLGGDAKSQVSVELAIDGSLSDSSANPVCNSAIANEISSLQENKQDKMDFERFIEQIKLACYPVGSYYWSSRDTSPDTLFGGSWERVKDRFILACGDETQADVLGGKSQLKLSAAIGATHNDIFSIGYIATTPNGYQSSREASYVLSGNEVGSSHKFWNHSVPVTEHDSAEWEFDSRPPFITAYCWKRIG